MHQVVTSIMSFDKENGIRPVVEAKNWRCGNCRRDIQRQTVGTGTVIRQVSFESSNNTYLSSHAPLAVQSSYSSLKTLRPDPILEQRITTSTFGVSSCLASPEYGESWNATEVSMPAVSSATQLTYEQRIRWQAKLYRSVCNN